MPSGKMLPDEVRVQLHLGTEQLERPDRSELRELLVERHPGQQVADAGLDRQARITVRRADDRHQPFTDPLVRPLTICRSANA
jgi:hypothetical protein